MTNGSKRLRVYLTRVRGAESRKAELDRFEQRYLTGTGISLSLHEHRVDGPEPVSTGGLEPGLLTPGQIADLFVENRPGDVSDWYTHGLILGESYPGRFEQGTFFTKPAGELWFFGDNPRERVRSKFLIFEKNEDATRPSLGHELLHILNVHHEDGPEIDRIKIHLGRHSREVNGLNHVMPGERGERWGSPPPAFHLGDLHGADPHTPRAAVRSVAGASPVQLTVLPQRPAYYNGEPISLSVTLSSGGPGQPPVYYQGHDSLNALSGQLVLYGGTDADELQPLVPPILWHRGAGKPSSLLMGSDTATGVGRWLGGLDPLGAPGSYWLRACYLGTTAGPVWSEPVEIRIDEIPAERSDEQRAQKLFLEPEVAKFLYLGGGPLEPEYRAPLEEVAVGQAGRFSRLAKTILAGLATSPV